MSTHTQLPVLQTVADVFLFTIKKFPSLFTLTLVAAVIAEPLTFLGLQFTGTFEEFASLGQSTGLIDRSIDSHLETGLCLLIVLMGVLLFLALVAVPMIRHITHGERLWFIRFNSNTFRYMLSQLPVLLTLVGIGLFAVMAMTDLGGIFTDTMGEPGVMTILLWVSIIALAYFGVRLSLIPVAAVASGSLNNNHGLALSKSNGVRLLMIILMIGLPILIVGLIAMDAVLQLYAPNQDSLAAVGEPQATNIFNGGPRQILELYVYIFSKPAFVAANMIVFLFLAFAVGSMLSIPAIAYRKLTS